MAKSAQDNGGETALIFCFVLVTVIRTNVSFDVALRSGGGLLDIYGLQLM